MFKKCSFSLTLKQESRTVHDVFSHSLSCLQAVHLSSCDVLPPEPTANVAAVVTKGQSQKSTEVNC